MDWVNRLNCAIDYIEENLTGSIDYDVAARIAWCSVFNFQRMFSYIVDMPLSEYIRRRRLTLAAFELQNSDTKIIDLAQKYGYDSHDSFTRAFHKLHGVLPSRARDKGVTLIACPRISFQLSIKGEKSMRYTIVDKEAFDVFGVEGIFSTVDDTNYKTSVPEFWQECHRNGSYERLFDDSGVGVRGAAHLGICAVNAVLNYRMTGKNTFPYMLCAFVNDKSQTMGYTRATIPALTWATFTSDEVSGDQLPETISQLFKRVYSEWLPAADYVKVDGPEFEIYEDAGDGRFIAEVWIPVAALAR